MLGEDNKYYFLKKGEQRHGEMGMQETVLHSMVRGCLTEKIRLGERLEVRDLAKQIPEGTDSQTGVRAMTLSA